MNETAKIRNENTINQNNSRNLQAGDNPVAGRTEEKEAVEKSCTKCEQRIGNLCRKLDQRLELLSVDKELEFKMPKQCK